MRTLQLIVGVVMCLITPALDVCAQTPANVSPLDYQGAREQAQQPAALGSSQTIMAMNEQIADAQAAYAVWSLDNRRAVFEWQYWSTIVIFGSVVGLIACGLYFSYTQFTAAPTATSPTSIKLGRDGLEINSPVIGLLVLFLSLGFFYLYLTNVYPIIEVGATAPASGVSVGADGTGTP